MAYIIPTLLIQGIYTGIIGTISAVTIGTISIVKTIYTHQNPDVTKIMAELDIERRLRLIQSVLYVIDKESKNRYVKMKFDDLEKSQMLELVDLKNDIDKDPIQLCLMFLHETIRDIHNDLEAINKKVAYHKTKWFNSWRTLNIRPKVDTLRNNSALLNARFDDLTKISLFLQRGQF